MNNASGEPIFFSNGYSIFRMDGSIMENGDSLPTIDVTGSYPFGYPMFVNMMGLPKPGHPGNYYFLQLQRSAIGTGIKLPDLLMAEVTHRSGPDSLFVSYKNKLLYGGYYLDYFNATKHANGRDWWVVFSDIVPATQKRTFKSILLGPDTTYIAQSQEISGYEPITTEPFPMSTKHRIFSPDGEYLISVNLLYGLKICIHSFDRCSGQLGSLITLPLETDILGIIGGVAVSSDSRFLYTANAKHIYQYDLKAVDIAASVVTVAEYDGFLEPSGQPAIFEYCQLGPDGKIYYMFHGTRYMHYIAKPNKKGIACGVVQRGLPLPSPASGIPFYPNYRLGPLDGTACDSLGLNNEPLADFWWFADSTLSVEFADNSSYEPAQWHWDFGDGGTSQDTSPVHLFPAPGSYDVCLIVSNQYAADTVCKAVTVGLSAGTEPEKADPEHFVRVFPNPADDFFQIVYHLQGGPKQFHLFDATGRLLRSRVLENGAGNVIFNIQTLPAGLYWYTLRGSNCMYSGRLIKH